MFKAWDDKMTVLWENFHAGFSIWDFIFLKCISLSNLDKQVKNIFTTTVSREGLPVHCGF